MRVTNRRADLFLSQVAARARITLRGTKKISKTARARENLSHDAKAGPKAPVPPRGRVFLPPLSPLFSVAAATISLSRSLPPKNTFSESNSSSFLASEQVQPRKKGRPSPPSLDLARFPSFAPSLSTSNKSLQSGSRKLQNEFRLGRRSYLRISYPRQGRRSGQFSLSLSLRSYEGGGA